MCAWTLKRGFFTAALVIAALVLCAFAGATLARVASRTGQQGCVSTPRSFGRDAWSLPNSPGASANAWSHPIAVTSVSYGRNSFTSSTAPGRKHRPARQKPLATRPLEAYIELPGMGTMVLSVQPDGRATLRHVPPHLNESNFTVEQQHGNLRTIRWEEGRCKVRKHWNMRGQA